MRTVRPDAGVLKGIRNKLEFNIELWKYLNWVTSDWKIDAGKKRRSGTRLCLSASKRISASSPPSCSASGGSFLQRRSPDRLDVSHWWNCNDAVANLDCGQHACRCGSLCRYLGSTEGSGFPSSWNLLERDSLSRAVHFQAKRKTRARKVSLADVAAAMMKKF
jgi:hypothetical protein